MRTKARIQTGLVLSVALILLMFASNYFLYPQTNYFSFLASDTILGELWQIAITFMYILVPIFLYLEKNNLQEFYIDRAGIIFFICSSFFTVFQVGMWYFILIITATVWTAIIAKKVWSIIPETNLTWIGIATLSITLVATCATLAIISLFDGNTQPVSETPNILSLLIYSIGIYGAREEFLFRCILWGYLNKTKMQPMLSFLLQFFLFWLLHNSNSTRPSFFISLPLAIITFSILALKSKQITPSIISHALYNVIHPLLFWIYHT